MRNPLSIEAFRDWCAKQSGEYNYCDSLGCAYFRYLLDAGLPVKSVGPGYWTDSSFARHRLLYAVDHALSADPETFEALTDRLDAAIAESGVAS